MWKTLLILLALGLSLGTTSMRAQVPNPSNLCITSSNYLVRSPKVACTVPQVYGQQGLAFGGLEGPLLGGGDIVGQFTQQDFLLSLNANVASQIALLPLVTPASGIAYTLDKSLGVYAESEDSFGPIFSERAATIGKNRVSIGFSYQYESFDTLDGINLQNFPTLYIQTSIPSGFGGRNCPSTFPVVEAQCHDYVTATNQIGLKIHQITPFITFGLTRKIDLSAAFPLLDVRMTASANASMEENSGEQDPNFFNTQFSGPACNPQGFGPCGLQASFSNSRHASGLGDITVRLKAKLKEWERAGLAAGVDVRVPTGEAMNFLGAGTVGIRPFAIWSYSGRISPHVNLGYEWNGKSILGADITTGGKDNLPSELLYSAGVEAALSRKLTAALDFRGQLVFDGSFDTLTQAVAPGPCTQNPNSLPTCLNVGALITTITPTNRTYGINNADLGLRYRPAGKFLVTASVQLNLDNGGLRSKAIPMVSATYTFR